MHFGWGKLPKIKTRYHGHLFGLRGRVISHWGKRQDGREHSVKLNLMNHSDRQARTEPRLPRTIFGNLGNGEKQTFSWTKLYLFVQKLESLDENKGTGSKQRSSMRSVVPPFLRI